MNPGCHATKKEGVNASLVYQVCSSVKISAESIGTDAKFALAHPGGGCYDSLGGSAKGRGTAGGDTH